MAAFFGVDYNLSISWRIKDNGSDVVVAHTHTHTQQQTRQIDTHKQQQQRQWQQH